MTVKITWNSASTDDVHLYLWQSELNTRHDVIECQFYAAYDQLALASSDTLDHPSVVLLHSFHCITYSRRLLA